MNIANHLIGPEYPVFVVAELGITANGSVSRACKLIDAVAEAGAQAAKFIVTNPDKVMSRRDVEFTYELMIQPHWAPIKKTTPLYDLLNDCLFSPAEWGTIREHCEYRNVIFFATVDHLDGVDLCESLSVPAYKLSAWDIAFMPLVERLRKTGRLILVDVGTATREEIAATITDEENFLFVHDPHPHDGVDWQMSRLRWLFRPGFPVGFSSPGRESWCDFMALGGGACLIEKRLTLSRNEQTGHHHAISLEPHEFANWVRQVRQAEAALREDPFGGSAHAWAQRTKYDRGPDGRQP